MAFLRRYFLLCALFSLALFCCGCETAKGAASGVACGVGSTAQGIGKDAKNTYSFLKSTDAWMRKNLW